MVSKRLFVNSRFTTLDPSCPFAEAVYVEDGRIRMVGSYEEVILQAGRADVERVDVGGGYGYPGLVDSHLHLAAYGMKLSMLDFSRVTTKAELLEMVRERARMTPHGEWVRGLHWDENRLQEQEPPTREELDRAAPHHPVMLTRHCFHVQAANTEAFRRAGISRETPDPSDGAFGRDERGELDGLVYENASRRLYEAMPPSSREMKKEWLRKAAREALSKGLTGVHTEDLRELGSVSDAWHMYGELTEEGIYLRSHHLIYHPFLEEAADFGLQTGTGDSWRKTGAMKMFADGSIGGRTALLSSPYTDDPSARGMAIHSQQELNEWVRRAREKGFSVGVHAIGDGAAEMVVRAFQSHPIPPAGWQRKCDRLIHGQVLRSDLVQALKHLPVVVDIQPRFVVSDFPWVAERLGSERLAYAYAWKTLLMSGVDCAGGSDAPIEPLDPILGLHAAITRRPPEDPAGGYLPEQKLTPLEALRLFTIGSAVAAGEENERGTCSPGKAADFTVFDRDLLAANADALLEARVCMTVVNGCIAYRR
jgi:predicted amidohydrolase YtcJ